MSPRKDRPWRTPTIDGQIEAIRTHGRHPRPRRQRMYPRVAGSAGALIVVLAALAVIFSGGGARADPTQSAAAAERARTLTFTSYSILRAAGQAPQIAHEEGAINLAQPGYRIRIFSVGRPLGFERRVFPRAVYVRPLRRHGPSPWVAAELSPPAVIAPTAQGSNGLADPLGLLAVLRHVPSKLLGRERVEGTTLEHYRAMTTLDQYLQAIGQPVPPSLSSAGVVIDVWLDSTNRVHRAVRRFSIPGTASATLEIRNHFQNYGHPIAIEAPPGVQLVGSEPLDPVANDPVSANVLKDLEAHTHHPKRHQSATGGDGWP
jgi:hypothetical protein